MNRKFKNLRKSFLDIHSQNIYARFPASKMNGMLRSCGTKINKENIRKKSKGHNSAMNQKLKILRKPFLDIRPQNIYARFQASQMNGVLRSCSTKINKEYIREKVKKGQNSAMNKKLKNLRKPFLDIHSQNIYAGFQGSKINDVLRSCGTNKFTKLTKNI